jgi:hypothetical protein
LNDSINIHATTPDGDEVVKSPSMGFLLTESEKCDFHFPYNSLQINGRDDNFLQSHQMVTQIVGCLRPQRLMNHAGYNAPAPLNPCYSKIIQYKSDLQSVYLMTL